MLQRTRHERRGCNRSVPCAGSLSLGRLMKILKKNAPPELSGHHRKSMLSLVGVAAVGGASVIMPTEVFGMEFTWAMGAPFLCVPVIFLLIMISRSSAANCPECRRKMIKKERVDVIEDHRVFGRYGCSPWNVFCCDFCQRKWRVPAIAIGEGGSVSRKEYERIEQAGSSNGG